MISGISLGRRRTSRSNINCLRQPIAANADVLEQLATKHPQRESRNCTGGVPGRDQALRTPPRKSLALNSEHRIAPSTSTSRREPNLPGSKYDLPLTAMTRAGMFGLHNHSRPPFHKLRSGARLVRRAFRTNEGHTHDFHEDEIARRHRHRSISTFDCCRQVRVVRCRIVMQARRGDLFDGQDRRANIH